MQYFQFASILGFYRWEDIGDAQDMPLEGKGRKVVDGRVMELRRLVREAILFVPRKFSKTTSTASLAVNDLLFGDANAQAYTGANSGRQAKICFNEIKGIVNQLDPENGVLKRIESGLDGSRLMHTERNRLWSAFRVEETLRMG